MINSVGPSFTGRTPIKASKTAGKVTKRILENSSKEVKTKPKTSICKQIFDDMLYGLEMFAETFKIKL